MTLSNTHCDEPEDDLITTSVLVNQIGSFAEKHTSRRCGLKYLLGRGSPGMQRTAGEQPPRLLQCWVAC